MAVATEKMI